MNDRVNDKMLDRIYIYERLKEADKQIAEGRILDADAALKALRAKLFGNRNGKDIS